MGPNMYLYQKARETYHQDLRREAEMRRVLAHLPRRSMSRRAAGKFGLLLLKLGAWLKEFEQSPSMLEDHA